MNTTRSQRCASTLELLNGLDCRWGLLRDTDATGSEPVEYDVLVDGGRRSVRRGLAASGARPIRSWGRSPHRQYDFWDESLRRPVRLDLVDELAFGRVHELRIDRREAVLDASTVRDGWTRPAESHEQWLALLHALLDREQLRPRDIERMDPWVAQVDDTVVRDLPGPLRTALHEIASARDWDALGLRRGEIRAALQASQTAGAARRASWRTAMRRTTKLQKAVLRPGVRVALLGPDGAGKSSTIEMLIESETVGSAVYLGVAPAAERRPTTLPGVALLRTVRRLGGAWLTASLRRRRGESVALDRHPLEATIGPPTIKTSTRTRRWILAHLLPRPEVVVVLMAPPEVLQERKPEHDLADVIARRARYVELARERGYPVIDTTARPSDVLVEIRRVMHGAQRGHRR